MKLTMTKTFPKMVRRDKIPATTAMTMDSMYEYPSPDVGPLVSLEKRLVMKMVEFLYKSSAFIYGKMVVSEKTSGDVASMMMILVPVLYFLSQS